MTESLRNDIIRLFGQGLLQRRIAQQLHVSRHTVHDALQQVATARDQGPAAAPPARSARMWIQTCTTLKRPMTVAPMATAGLNAPPESGPTA